MSVIKLVDLCAAADVPEGEIRRKTLPCGKNVAVYRVKGEYFVTDDICSHGEASLSEEGTLDGYEVECSWHFGRFDVRTGEPRAMPCENPLPRWPAKVEQGRVFVETEDEAP